VALGAYSGQRDDLVTAFEKGTISEEDFSSKFAARLKEETGKEVAPEGIVDRLFASLGLEEDMIGAVIKARDKGYKTALLSNSWGLGMYPRDRFEAMFDVVVISGEVSMRKPDAEIFHLTTEKLGVEAKRSIFVDDHPGHLAAAERLGMRTILHRTPAQTLAELEPLLAL
ncbi:MAG: HAD-IA family hydrolase, partial [Actinomycetota bacterium]